MDMLTWNNIDLLREKSVWWDCNTEDRNGVHVSVVIDPYVIKKMFGTKIKSVTSYQKL